MQADRRKHQRLAIRLLLDCRRPGEAQPARAFTQDISTGGVAFELDLPTGSPRPEPQSVLGLDVRVPPGAGHSPYEGRVSATAEVLRCDRTADARSGCDRYAVAVRFKQPLQLQF